MADSGTLPGDRGGESRLALAAAAITLLAACALIAAAAIDGGKDGIGGVLRFREDGGGIEVYGELLLAVSVVVLAGLIGALASGGERQVTLATLLLAKVLLILAVVFMFAFPELSQFEGKSLTYRAILYPSLAFGPSLLFLWRGRGGPFPLLWDLCLTFALVFDIVSNDLHWYGTWLHWDDAVHFFNTLPIMVFIFGGMTALESSGRIRLGLWGCFVFAYCIYALIHGLWEMEEFALDRFAGTNLQPGGMEEATRNNVAGLVAGALSAPLFLWWRRLRCLERHLSDPLAGYVSLVRHGGRRLPG
jgi:hypothetical protein